jgi:hypothetical protein
MGERVLVLPTLSYVGLERPYNFEATARILLNSATFDGACGNIRSCFVSRLNILIKLFFSPTKLCETAAYPWHHFCLIGKKARRQCSGR